jgi:hypothetical protein
LIVGIDQRRYLRWCAITGMTLPAMVVLLAGGILPSLSAAYYSNAHDVFVGQLFIVGGLLGFYSGFDWRDRTMSATAGASAPLIATLPIAPAGATTWQTWVGYGHFAAAIVFFACLAWFCLHLFPLTGGKPTAEKLIRNKVYRASGTLIVGCMVLLVLAATLFKSSPAVFWIEAAMVEAFGLAFLVKSEFLLRDKPAA